MADPQVEDGYTRIANELLEAILRFPFSKREHLVVMAIIRKTYGFNKKADDMSGQQLADLTGLKRQHVNVCVRDLSLKKVVLKRDGQYGQVLGINKKYSEWLLVPKQDYLVPKQDTSQNGTTASPKTGPELVPKQDTQKTTPKDNSKRQAQPKTDSPKTGLAERFKKPTLEDVKAYCLERQNQVDADRWWNYYEANGWKVGRNPMKNWKAAVHTWERSSQGGQVTSPEDRPWHETRTGIIAKGQEIGLAPESFPDFQSFRTAVCRKEGIAA